MNFVEEKQTVSEELTTAMYNERSKALKEYEEIKKEFDRLMSNLLNLKTKELKQLREISAELGAAEEDVYLINKDIKSYKEATEELEDLKNLLEKTRGKENKAIVEKAIETSQTNFDELEAELYDWYVLRNKKEDNTAEVIKPNDENQKMTTSKRWVIALRLLGISLLAVAVAVSAHNCKKDEKTKKVLPLPKRITNEQKVEVSQVEKTEEEKIAEEVSNYDVNTFDDINDQAKVQARAESIYNDIFEAVKGTELENVTLKYYNIDKVVQMLNYFNDGMIANYQAGDSLELMNDVDGLTNMEGELNIILPLYKFQLDGTFGQDVAYETYEARVKMMNGQNTEDKELGESGVADLATNLYKTFVMPGLDGHVSVTNLESAGSKAFNLKYIMASNALAKETNEKVTILDDCEEELSWKELNGAVNYGKKLKNHEDELNVEIIGGNGSCVYITYLSSYCMGADQEMLIKNEANVLELK